MLLRTWFPLLLLLSGCAATRIACDVRDISGAPTGEEAAWLLKLTSTEWMRTATVCPLGDFTVAVPTGEAGKDARIVLLLRKGRPVFFRSQESTSVYSPKLADDSFERVLVNIWHGNDSDTIERLWYDTIGKEPRVTVDDTHFVGQPDLKIIWRDHEIAEGYRWIDNQWQRIEPKRTNP